MKLDFSSGANALAQGLQSISQGVTSAAMQKQQQDQYKKQLSEQRLFESNARKYGLDLMRLTNDKYQHYRDNWNVPDFDRESFDTDFENSMVEFYESNIKGTLNEDQQAQFESNVLYPYIENGLSSLYELSSQMDMNKANETEIGNIQNYSLEVDNGANVGIIWDSVEESVNSLYNGGYFASETEKESYLTTKRLNLNSTYIRSRVTKMIDQGKLIDQDFDKFMNDIFYGGKELNPLAESIRNDLVEGTGGVITREDQDALRTELSGKAQYFQAKKNNEINAEINSVSMDLYALDDKQQGGITSDDLNSAIQGKDGDVQKAIKYAFNPTVRKNEDTRLWKEVSQTVNSFRPTTSQKDTDEMISYLEGLKFNYPDQYTQDVSSAIETLKTNHDTTVQKAVAEQAAQFDVYGKGNINLYNLPIITGEDGKKSTVSSMSFSEGGQEILIPTIINGQKVSEEEAIAWYHATGQHLGKFDSDKEANAYAQELQNKQSEYLDGVLITDEEEEMLSQMYNEQTQAELRSSITTGRADQILSNIETQEEHKRNQSFNSLFEEMTRHNVRKETKQDMLSKAYMNGDITYDQMNKLETLQGKFKYTEAFQGLLDRVPIYLDSFLNEEENPVTYNRIKNNLYTAIYDQVESIDDDSDTAVQQMAKSILNTDEMYQEYLKYQYGAKTEQSWDITSNDSDFATLTRMASEGDYLNFQTLSPDLYKNLESAGLRGIRAEFGDGNYQIIQDDKGPMYKVGNLSGKGDLIQALRSAGLRVSSDEYENVQLVAQYGQSTQEGVRTVMKIGMQLQEVDAAGRDVGEPVYQFIEYKPTSDLLTKEKVDEDGTERLRTSVYGNDPTYKIVDETVVGMRDQGMTEGEIRDHLLNTLGMNQAFVEDSIERRMDNSSELNDYESPIEVKGLNSFIKR